MSLPYNLEGLGKYLPYTLEGLGKVSSIYLGRAGENPCLESGRREAGGMGPRLQVTRLQALHQRAARFYTLTPKNIFFFFQYSCRLSTHFSRGCGSITSRDIIT
jgi:hypothetical protein